jgi:2-oxoisovalerate dehydrogenase E2 component (dihydrolipoyl transacylase)
VGTYVVKLPDVGEGVAEAEIVEWHVSVGDTIHEDDVLAAVMTDKATVELPSPVDGTVRSLGAEVGEILAVGAALVTIDTDSTGTPTPPEAPATEPAPEPTPEPDVSAAESAPLGADSAARTAGVERPTAAPAVRARARDLGVGLDAVTGTGPDGRVTHGDLDTYLTASRPPAAAPARPPTEAGVDAIEPVKVVGLRRNIAERMAASKRKIPHFTYVDEIDVSELERLRAELNLAQSDGRPKLSLLPFLMRAVVQAVATHPEMNARFDDEAGVVNRHSAVHLGIAVQTSRGLMVPVIKDAGSLDLWASATEVARLAEAARTAKITLEELTGSTITITSLGALGGIVSTPVINAPEVAIVGVNKVVSRPVYVDGQLLPRQIMNLSSSFDHRVVDGADAAEFIQTVKWLLETPALLFV